MKKERFAEILARRLKDYQIEYLWDRIVRHDISEHDAYAIGLSEHGYPQSAEYRDSQAAKKAERAVMQAARVDGVNSIGKLRDELERQSKAGNLQDIDPQEISIAIFTLLNSGRLALGGSDTRTLSVPDKPVPLY